jgi:hypothetical protein
MQSAAVRRLNVGGIFTTATSATFIFPAGDFANEPLTREERRRLTGVIVSLMIGATFGALLLIHLPIYAPLPPRYHSGSRRNGCEVACLTRPATTRLNDWGE